MSLQSSKCKPFKPLLVQRKILSVGVKINYLKLETKKLSVECFKTISIDNKKWAPKFPPALSKIQLIPKS